MRMRTHRGRDRDDRGQVALEYIGFIAILLLVGLAAIQLGVAAYAANQAGTGARAAAPSWIAARPTSSRMAMNPMYSRAT